MAITKGGVNLENAQFSFRADGDVDGVVIKINYPILDGAGDDAVEIAHPVKTIDVWDDLTPTQKASANILGKLFLTLAGSRA